MCSVKFKLPCATFGQKAGPQLLFSQKSLLVLRSGDCRGSVYMICVWLYSSAQHLSSGLMAARTNQHLKCSSLLFDEMSCWSVSGYNRLHERECTFTVCSSHVYTLLDSVCTLWDMLLLNEACALSWYKLNFNSGLKGWCCEHCLC